MDPLSDVLSLLRFSSHVAAGFYTGGDWSLHFKRYEGIKFNAVVSGGCWLQVDGMAEAVRLEAGDCFLLFHGNAFRMASNLALPPVDGASVFSPVSRGGIARHQGGGEFFLLGSRFTLSGRHADVLLGVVPPLIHIRDAADQGAQRRGGDSELSLPWRAHPPC